MTKKLWVATSNVKANSNLYNYEKFISKKFNQEFNQEYIKILSWSIENLDNFWNTIWDYCKVKGINVIKKHEKTTKEKKGGIISKENFIHLSNLKNLDTKDKINKAEDKK